MVAGGRSTVRAGGLLVGCWLLAGCSGGVGPIGSDPSVPAVPPAPPAACLLDTVALAAATGLGWAPDETTASDTRCVYDPDDYDPDGSPDGGEFVAVDIAPSTAADTELDAIAGVCDGGSRAPVAGADGFVCRFQGGTVFAALVLGGRVVTITASAVPANTTAARLVAGFGEQLRLLDS